jgi:cell division protein FtsB
VSINEWSGKALGWINGPYRALAIVLLAVLLVLFGRDAMESFRAQREINDLKKRRLELEQRICRDSTLLRNLDDADFLEQYAREHYLMRKEGEDVYIVED